MHNLKMQLKVSKVKFETNTILSILFHYDGFMQKLYVFANTGNFKNKLCGETVSLWNS